jgi:membrane protein insertase Oxa1/YidC/SpoIIIJ
MNPLFWEAAARPFMLLLLLVIAWPIKALFWYLLRDLPQVRRVLFAKVW